jgi:hypothetical protein
MFVEGLVGAVLITGHSLPHRVPSMNTVLSSPSLRHFALPGLEADGPGVAATGAAKPRAGVVGRAGPSLCWQVHRGQYLRVGFLRPDQRNHVQGGAIRPVPLLRGLHHLGPQGLPEAVFSQAAPYPARPAHAGQGQP